MGNSGSVPTVRSKNSKVPPASGLPDLEADSLPTKFVSWYKPVQSLPLLLPENWIASILAVSLGLTNVS